MLEGFRHVRRELGVPEEFPSDVLADAEQAADRGPVLPPGARNHIRDARDIALVAIDPEGSMDLDQAYSAIRLGKGYRVYYAIADVASLVAPGGRVDLEARSRGLTLYSPDLRTSLHPHRINEDAGSLLEGQERQSLLWSIDLDAEGAIDNAHIERATVVNRAQLSYRHAQEMLTDADRDHPLALLREIGMLRLEREADRGAVSLALPSQEVYEAADGSFQLEYDQSLPIEDWNAQISLLTGIAASRIMLESGEGLLRTLPPPEHRTISRLRRTARALGIDWPGEMSYADRIRGLHPDTPARAAMLSQAARGLRGAGYVSFHHHDLPEQPTHSAIASTYSHVTAPLRRLCDRFSNEILVANCADHKVPGWASEALDELPGLMGAAKQRDRSLERAVVDFVEAVTLESRIGQTFEAVVTDIDERRGRARVQLRDPAVVTKISSDGLTLGAEIELRLDHVDCLARKVDFTTVG